MKENIGIVGFGSVGKAIYETLHSVMNIFVYDKYIAKTNSLHNTIKSSSFIFISVPTPTINGKQDISAIEETLDFISKNSTKKIIIIKSTILPGTTRMLSNKYINNDIVFCPEFLTELNSINDFKNSKYFILSGNIEATNKVQKMLEIYFKNSTFYHTTWETAELLKYMRNCFLAVKVSLCNEFYRISKSINVEYKILSFLFGIDDRIGPSHTIVPGPDGLFGYGGKCLPKDVNAFLEWLSDNKIKAPVCIGTKTTNDEVRVIE